MIGGVNLGKYWEHWPLEGGRRVVVYCQYASELVSRPIR